jgi:hypothetical protein
MTFLMGDLLSPGGEELRRGIHPHPFDRLRTGQFLPPPRADTQVCPYKSPLSRQERGRE